MVEWKREPPSAHSHRLLWESSVLVENLRRRLKWISISIYFCFGIIVVVIVDGVGRGNVCIFFSHYFVRKQQKNSTHYGNRLPINCSVLLLFNLFSLTLLAPNPMCIVPFRA